MSTPTALPANGSTDPHAQEPFHQAILTTLPIAVAVYQVVSHTDFRLVYINPTGRERAPTSSMEIIGKSLEELMPAASADRALRRFQECLTSGVAHTSEDSYELENYQIWTTTTFAPMRDADGRTTHILTSWKDITAEKQRQFAEQQRKEEIIDQQAAALAELSTPLLTISETTVVMPLVGAVDSRRVTQIMDTLLHGVAASRASIVILDITGVSIVDTQVANAFIRASQAVQLLGAQAVQLLGAQVVLTGIRPEVAQTLVQLGVDLRSIITRGTLRDGITYAMQH